MDPSEPASAQGSGLHFAFQSDVLLFSNLRLSSWPMFILACFLTSSICFLERFITLLLTSRAHPSKWQNDLSPMHIALYRTALYAVATTLRLAYMLISMTLHVGIIAVILISLAIGQFYIELRETSAPSGGASGSHSSKGPIYHPIPLYKTHALSTPDIDDLESAPSSNSGTWDGNREARDKARQIMLGTTYTSTSGPMSSQVHTQHFDQSDYPRFPKRGSAVRFSDAHRVSSNLADVSPPHRRQSSGGSPVRGYRGQGSSSSLQHGLRGGGSFGSRTSNNLTPTNSARKALFQIGSGDEHTTESD